MHRLGGRIISTEHAQAFSSEVAGEHVEDTIRIVGGYSDVIVIRHYQEGGAKRAARVSPVPVINAGDSEGGQHPTQALLDALTIRDRKGRLDGLHVTILGDIIRMDANGGSTILDLRHNTGGDNFGPLARMLAENERINQPERLFVLIGRQTFSAGIATWDPETDPYIARYYNAVRLPAKLENKRALQVRHRGLGPRPGPGRPPASATGGGTRA